MTTVVLIIVVAVLIGAFAAFTNAGFGDRRPKDKPKKPPANQDSGEDAPPPSK
jgi:hypothetical protein